MALRRVWAFRPLQELSFETGWVDCEEELARKLIAENLAQDPSVGALALKEIEAAAPNALSDEAQHKQLNARFYETTQLQPEDQHTTDLTPPKGRKPRR